MNDILIGHALHVLLLRQTCGNMYDGSVATRVSLTDFSPHELRSQV